MAGAFSSAFSSAFDIAVAATTTDTAGDVATADEIRRLEAAYRKVAEAREKSQKERRQAERRLTETITKAYRRLVEHQPDVAEEIAAAVAPEAPVTLGKPVSVAALRAAMVGHTEDVAGEMIARLRQWQDGVIATQELERLRVEAEIAADENDVEMLLLALN